MTTSFHQYLDPQVYRVTQNGFFIVVFVQRAVFKHCLFLATTKIFTINLDDIQTKSYVLFQNNPKMSYQKIKYNCRKQRRQKYNISNKLYLN